VDGGARGRFACRDHRMVGADLMPTGTDGITSRAGGAGCSRPPGLARSADRAGRSRRKLSRHREDRGGRHGCGLQGRAPAPGQDGGGEGAPAGALAEPRHRQPVLQRGEGGHRDPPPRHRRDLRLRLPAERHGLHHDGAARRRAAVAGAGRPRAPDRARGALVHARHRQRAGRGARAGHHPPRPQARQHLPRARPGHARRPAPEDPRLRDRQGHRGAADRRRVEDPHRRGARHADVHEPGAVPRHRR
jgi:hypothetical protein